jgi:hypothetical protein
MCATSKLGVRARRLFGLQRNLFLRDAGNDIDNTKQGRIAILDVEHPVISDGHCGMHLVARGWFIVPHNFLVWRDFGKSKLMREENVSALQHHRVADFALARGVGETPRDLSSAHDEDVAVMRFARVEKVVLRKPAAWQRRGRGRQLRMNSKGN